MPRLPPSPPPVLVYVRDCALTRFAEFVDGHTHLSSHNTQVQYQPVPPSPYPQPDLGPLTGREGGFQNEGVLEVGIGRVELTYVNPRS